MLIYCQTNRIALNEFELIRTQYVGLSSIGETIDEYTVSDNDRLQATILNVGFACKELSQMPTDTIKIVGIESDQDGKDFRHGGEQDILYNLLNPKDDFEARKIRSLYYSYGRYLGRIKTLQLQNDIRFVLQEGDGVKYN